MSQAYEVGIRCVTYNHAAYIRQALDGFVSQQTSFRYRAVIHDDASTDGTQEILREYQEKYPNKIHVVFEKENQYSQGVVDFSPKINHFLQECKYIALCEGDDEWIYPHKLQKQYDFMEAHPEVAMCFHNALNWTAETKKHENLINELDTGYVSDEDCFFFTHGHFPTCSMFLRAEYLLNLPAYAKKAPVGDDPLTQNCAFRGKIFYMDKVWGIRNYMHSGSWNVRFRSQPLVYFDYIERFVEYCLAHEKYTRGKYSEYINRKISNLLNACVGKLLPNSVWSIDELLTAISEAKEKTHHKFDEIINLEFNVLLAYCSDYLPYVEEKVASAKQDGFKVYIYGAGKVAQKLLRDLLVAKVDGMVVTNLADNKASILGKQVRSYNDVQAHGEKFRLILGMDAVNKREVLYKDIVDRTTIIG